MRQVIASIAGIALATSVHADQPVLSYSNFGTVGLLDMPTAMSAPDGEFSGAMSFFAGATRTTLTFQITPRLSGSFRYTGIKNWVTGTGKGTFDRSFDLRYRIVDEGKYRPAIAIGLQDFIGTGIYSGEYIVATKHLNPRFAVTGGIGWGRLGSYNGFSNPLGVFSSKFNTRPGGYTGTGGQIESARWFRGNAALFGGAAWQASDRLTLKAEYSSDAYVRETARGHFARKSPFNFGFDYKVGAGITAQLAYLYGSEVSAGIHIALNPKTPSVIGGNHGAPIPVKVRARRSAEDLGWTTQASGPKILRDNVQTLLAADGMSLEAMKVSPHGAVVHIRNNRYLAPAEAIGRTARILTNIMPASVESFTIVPVVKGMPTSAVTLQRSDLEQLEHDPDGAWRSFARAKINDGADYRDGLTYREGLYPKFTWNLGPYVSASYFDPDRPVAVDVGLQLSAKYEVSPGLILSGAVQKKLVGNKSSLNRVSNSTIRHVRSDANLYNQAGDPAITDLTLAYFFRPGKDLYGRVTAGYLERMYGGISAEILWKPVNSKFALGAELNYVKQREFDQMFGFRSYEVATGHVSGYLEMGNGFHGQLDVGRYLAGDWGATLSLDREFRNGWRIGAYATFTTVSFSDFGEGSFDKGIRFTIPLEHFTGKPTNKTYAATLQPLSRDGGARLDVSDRLYETVRNQHGSNLRNSWGRFWR